MESYTRGSLEGDDCGSKDYDVYEEGKQVDHGFGQTSNEALIESSNSRRSTIQDRESVRPDSLHTASVPTIQHGHTGSQRRPSNSTTQTSRPTTSSQTSNRDASTAPTSTPSSRPHSRHYSDFALLAGPSNVLPRDTQSLLRRSVTSAPRPLAGSWASYNPSNCIDYEDDYSPPLTIRGVSYPGRSGELIPIYSSLNLPLTPLSPDHDLQYSSTSILSSNPSFTTVQRQTYSNYTPPANIDWTSPETRRKHYSKIDKATTGFRGVWTRFAPRKLGGGSKYGRFYDESGSDAGSVRRFRQDLEDEKMGAEGTNAKKRRFFRHGNGRLKLA